MLADEYILSFISLSAHIQPTEPDSYRVSSGSGLDIMKYQHSSKPCPLSQKKTRHRCPLSIYYYLYYIYHRMLLPEPYNPAWKTGFEKLKTVLETLLRGLDTDIQHVGSTAVPALYAKPILDIDIIIRDKDLLPLITPRLEKYGYLSKGDQGIPGRLAFRQSSVYTPATENRQSWPVHHLYVCYADSLALKNHLLFRDALLKNKTLADQYSRLKQSLAASKTVTREEYTLQKTEFVLSVLAEAGLDDIALKEIRDANR